jgi:LPS-assembly protein
MPLAPARPARLLLACLALLLAAPLRAQAGSLTPQATGRETSYDDKTKELVLRGDARLTYGELVLLADEIRYNGESQTVTAVGHFVLSTANRRLVADHGTYNLADGTLHIRHLRLGQFPIYLMGDTVDGTLDHLVLTNATIFFRENARYSPSIKARRLVYQRDRIVAGEDLELGLLGGHFLKLPKFEHDLHTDLISYLSGRLGYRRNLGALAEFGVHLPVAEGSRLGVDGGLYGARGVMIGPSGNYSLVRDGRFARGFFRSGYINDHGDKLRDILGRPVPEERGYFEWQHQQRAGRFSLNGQFNYWSDSEIVRDFRPKFFFPVQQPDSFLEAAYTGDNYVLSAFSRLHPNRYHRVQERLPEVRFDLLPFPIGGGLYERFNAGFAVLEEDSYLATPRQRSTRLDAYYGLERPIAPAPWLTVTPVAGGRFTRYADAGGAKSTYTRTFAEVGFDAALRASGTFDYQNAIWEIDGLRHLIEPRLSYRYAPRADDGRPFIPALDRQVFTTHLPPLSLADQRNVDQLDRLDTLRLSLPNTLQTRDPVYGSRDLAALNFAADYRFSGHTAGRRALSDIYTEVALTPAPWLRFEAFHRFNPHTPAQDELNYGIELTDQHWWSVRLASHFLRQDYEEYLLDYRQRLNEVFDLNGRWRYDARHSRFNEQTYGVSHRLGQTWAIRYEVSFAEGPRRESSFGFNLEVELLKF